MPVTSAEFIWLYPHLDRELVLKTWQNNKILAAWSRFLPLVETDARPFLDGCYCNINNKKTSYLISYLSFTSGYRLAVRGFSTKNLPQLHHFCAERPFENFHGRIWAIASGKCEGYQKNCNFFLPLSILPEPVMGGLLEENLQTFLCSPKPARGVCSKITYRPSCLAQNKCTRLEPPSFFLFQVMISCTTLCIILYLKYASNIDTKGKKH